MGCTAALNAETFGARMTARYRLERVQRIAQPLETVFSFFADAGNLERITPPFLHFRILTPLPVAMQVGTRIEYHLRLVGVPIQWTTRIEDYAPPHRFVDSQLCGPYQHWVHLHTFSADADGTLMRDVVDYDIPYGMIGTLAQKLFVARMLERIFDYRREAITVLLG